MTEERQILFQRYIDDDLSEEERKQFEISLQEDSEFRADYELYSQMHTHLSERVKYDKSLSALKEVHIEQTKLRSEEVPIQSVKKSRINWWLLSSAAAIALLAVFFFFNTKTKPVQFADVYVAPAWPTSRSGDDRLGELFSLYQQGLKEQAFDSVYTTDLLSEDQRAYWLAEMYLAEMKGDSVLKYVGHVNSPSFKRDRCYYLEAVALYLKKDKATLELYIQKLPKNIDNYYLNIIHKMR